MKIEASVGTGEREIEEAIGRELTDRLMQAFGGTKLYVPMAIGDDHPICRVLGREGADKFSAWAACCLLDIPMVTLGTDMREWIIAERRSGKTVAQIARSLNISERQTYRRLQKGPKKPDAGRV